MHSNNMPPPQYAPEPGYAGAKYSDGSAGGGQTYQYYETRKTPVGIVSPNQAASNEYYNQQQQQQRYQYMAQQQHSYSHSVSAASQHSSGSEKRAPLAVFQKPRPQQQEQWIELPPQQQQPHYNNSLPKPHKRMDEGEYVISSPEKLSGDPERVALPPANSYQQNNAGVFDGSNQAHIYSNIGEADNSSSHTGNSSANYGQNISNNTVVTQTISHDSGVTFDDVEKE